jgi:hypothetical protein
MKFAKIVFWTASIFGVLIVTPLFFIGGMIARLDPPPLTHPQFYYGFAGVALVWQFAYLAIATDPARFRPMMILSALAKFSFVLTNIVLCLQGRIPASESLTSAPDALFALLFVIAFFKVGPSELRKAN